MKIIFFGLSITSSWGNGHATTYRALCDALYRRGHRIVFFERDQEWYRNNRDLADPPYCDLEIFQEWQGALPTVRAELHDADIAVVGSYFQDGIAALDEVLESAVAVKAFYDIDTPVTVGRLRECGATEYLLARRIPEVDVYFSFTGGPILLELETRFGAKLAAPLYCSVDPERHCKLTAYQEFAWDLSYMGTYAPDRQPKVEELLCGPARKLPERKFIVAGPQYPVSLAWPGNVERVTHLSPRYHAEFYGSSRLTLNVTRREMVMAGYSPSVRLFEAAACGATIVSDQWPGLETFFAAGKEILLSAGGGDVLRYITEYSSDELRRIGYAAAERVLAAHTSDIRAHEFERAAEAALRKRKEPAALAAQS
ncbi:MAG TPA: glycosyltransferase [Candidatus Angelobacter sp.]|nr:glycosyltransferase [Candidatus Angelobacter sp.]